jgi:hypothetical protein
MNTDTENRNNASIASALSIPRDQPTFRPAEAVRWLTRDVRSGNNPNHVERDIATLRRAGITPEKVAGRWIVRTGELERFANAPAAEPQRIDRRRREHSHLRSSAQQEVRHG